MNKEKLISANIKAIKTKTFYNTSDITEIEDTEDKLIISGYANRYKNDNGIVVDRDGDSVVPSGMDIKNYQNNPVVLYSHDSRDIIGKALHTELKEDGVWMQMEIYKSLNPKVYQAIKLGILKTFSIGFSASEVEYKELDSGEGVYFFTKTSLHECSVVAIPANQQSFVDTVTIDEKSFMSMSAKSVGSLVKTESLEKETHQTTLLELKDMIVELTKSIETLRTEKEVPEVKDEDEAEVPDGAAETLPKKDEEAPGATEEVVVVVEDKTMLEEVNSMDINEATFDELLQVQEVLNSRLNTFLNDTLN